MKAPERIWISEQPDYWENNLATAFTLLNGSHNIEYVRADLFDAQAAAIKELTEALEEIKAVAEYYGDFNTSDLVGKILIKAKGGDV